MAKRKMTNLLGGLLVVLWVAGCIESNPQPSPEAGADVYTPGGADVAGLADVTEKTDGGVQDIVAADADAVDKVAVDVDAADAADQAGEPDVCQPQCEGKECGDDGCGGSCGECDPGCPLPTICDSGVCLATCEPLCDGKECGDDGCGCPCGECDDGKPCTDDSCVDGACQFTPSPDNTPCGDSDEPWAEDYQHCLQGVCCHPNLNWCWDGICDCEGWPMYGTCESECDAIVDDTDWGAVCVWECGGDCCNTDADCLDDKPQCAQILSPKYEGMWPTGRCVEQASYPACWWSSEECQEGELCVGAPTADDCPYCNVSCPNLKPGLCVPADVCGNGLVEPDLGETCDDGNTEDGDGCDHSCQLEPGCAPCVCKNCNVWGCCEMDLIHCDADDEFVCVCQTPGPEECDGIDNDCDGQVDEGFPDTDMDGLADCIDLDDDNDGDNDDTDCAPLDLNIHHGAAEQCNGVDDDCDGEVDEWCDCIPDCNGKECGDDGCGGSCGECPVKCTTHDQCGAGEVCLGEPEGWPPMEICGLCGDVEACQCAAPSWPVQYVCTTDADCKQNLMCGGQCDDCPGCPKCVHGWCAYETFDSVECLCSGCG